jgi:HSP20 family molecular chaperone IbpA
MGSFLFNFLDWDKDFYSFNRSIKDCYPYEIVRKESQSIIVFNALGLGKDNVTVTIDKLKGTEYLLISGEQKNEITNKTYSVNGRFVVDSSSIKGIDWKVQDGLLYVYVNFKQAEKPQISIKYKD